MRQPREEPAAKSEESHSVGGVGGKLSCREASEAQSDPAAEEKSALGAEKAEIIRGS